MYTTILCIVWMNRSKMEGNHHQKGREMKTNDSKPA